MGSRNGTCLTLTSVFLSKPALFLLFRISALTPIPLSQSTTHHRPSQPRLPTSPGAVGHHVLRILPLRFQFRPLST